MATLYRRVRTIDSRDSKRMSSASMQRAETSQDAPLLHQRGLRLPNEPLLPVHKQLRRPREPAILLALHSLFFHWRDLHAHLNHQHMETLHLHAKLGPDELPCLLRWSSQLLPFLL